MFFLLKVYILTLYMKFVDYSLVNKNLKYGISKEKPWRNRLSKKYPSIRDNNKDNKFSSMDSYSDDNGICIEHEHKQRNIKHNQYWSLFFNKSKFDKSVKKLEQNIRQIYYWTCKDGLYYWELTDPEAQIDEYEFGRNGNFQTGEGNRDIVNIRMDYIKKYED